MFPRRLPAPCQVSDLSFADDTADNEDWYSFYRDTFTPITNKYLKSYDGYSEVDNVKLYSSISNLHITDTSKSDVGLFSTFNGEIKNVTLTGMRIDNGGQNVGALIGSVSDTVKITNTRVYLSSKKGDLADIETVDSPEKVKPWLEGKVVGGLIGMVTKTAAYPLRTAPRLRSFVQTAAQQAASSVPCTCATNNRFLCGLLFDGSQNGRPYRKGRGRV